MKKAMYIAALLMALGLVLVAVAFFASGCNPSEWFLRDYETETHEPVGEFHSISVDADTADIILLPSEDGIARVVTYEKKPEKHSVAVEDGILRISLLEGEMKWYDYVSLWSGAARITVYLPKREYTSLRIAVDTGDVSLPAGFTFGEATFSGSTGDFDVSAAVTGMLGVTLSTGDVAIHDTSLGALAVKTSTGGIELLEVNCAGAVTLEQSTGTLTARGVTAASFSSQASTGRGRMTDLAVSGDIFLKRNTGDLTLSGCTAANLKAETSTGDQSLDRVAVTALITLVADTGEIELSASDAGEVSITTDTGDVEATFLTPKIFFATTDTGDIDIRESTVGGKCKVTTDTGDIELDFIAE